MLPLARELPHPGTTVVLAANSQPSINDITAPELSEAVQKAAELDPVIRRAELEAALIVVPSGNDLPVIDLRKVLGSCNIVRILLWKRWIDHKVGSLKFAIHLNPLHVSSKFWESAASPLHAGVPGGG